MFSTFGVHLFFGRGIVCVFLSFMSGSASVGTATHLSVDSLHGVGTFFQKQPIAVHPQLIYTSGNNWIFYMLFGLLLLIAFIRFFYPSATRAVLSWFSGTGFRKSDDNYSKPGLLVPSFLILNFIITFTLLVVVVRMYAGGRPGNISSPIQFWLFAAGGIVGFFLYNQISAFLIGFVFDTAGQASMQMKNNAAWAYVSGLFLTPMLLIYFYTLNSFLLGIMMAGSVILLLFKWFQTVKVGLTARSFNALHLFLYLCAVEIIPLLLLIKVCMI